MLNTYITYFLLLILTFTFSYLGLKKNKVQLKSDKNAVNNINNFKWNGYYVTALAILVIIAGIRKDVGADYYGYQLLIDNFNFYSPLYSFFKYEPLFIITILVLNISQSSYIYFFFIYAFFTWFFFYLSFRNNIQILPFVLVFIILNGFYFWTFNGVRQAVAITLFAFSINFIINKSFLKYAVTILVGLLFHYSIILLLPLYFIVNNKILDKIFNRISLLFLYFITLLLSELDVLREISQYVFFLIPKYEVHVNNMYTLTNEQNTGLGIIFNHITNIFIIVISKYVISKIPKSKLYFNIFFIGMLLANMVEGIQIFGRFVIYFTFFKYYVLGYITYYLLKQSNLESRTILSLLFLGYLILFIAIIHFGGTYQTILMN